MSPGGRPHRAAPYVCLRTRGFPELHSSDSVNTTKDAKRLFADIDELNRVGDDVFAVGACVGDFHPACFAFDEVVDAQGAEQFVVRGDLLLVDAECFFAGGVVDRDRGVCGSADVVAVRHPDFVAAGLGQIGSEDDCFLPFPFFLIVQIAETDVGRRVRGILPGADEPGLGFIDDDAFQFCGIGHVKGDEFGFIDLAGCVGVGDRVGVGFELGGWFAGAEGVLWNREADQQDRENACGFHERGFL